MSHARLGDACRLGEYRSASSGQSYMLDSNPYFVNLKMIPAEQLDVWHMALVAGASFWADPRQNASWCAEKHILSSVPRCQIGGLEKAITIYIYMLS